MTSAKLTASLPASSPPPPALVLVVVVPLPNGPVCSSLEVAPIFPPSPGLLTGPAAASSGTFISGGGRSGITLGGTISGTVKISVFITGAGAALGGSGGGGGILA